MYNETKQQNMYFLPLIIWIIIVYAIIRNIPVKHIWIILISVLIAFFQWHVVITYESIINDWIRPFPWIVAAAIQFIHGFIALILAIVIRKYFSWQKKKS